MWSWPNVLRRVSRGLLGIGRGRVTTPWVFLKRQLGYKAMLLSGLHTYVEGGLLRRPADPSARREVIDDDEARDYYLKGVVVPSALPKAMHDATSMESLPVLNDHYVSAARVVADQPAARVVAG